MKYIVDLVQQLQNLNRIKRRGGILALGLPEYANISVAEHCYCVNYLGMIFCDLVDKDVSVEKVLRYCIVHDWQESVLGDIPSGSPSYASYWDIDIHDQVEKAGVNVRREMAEFVKKEVNLGESVNIELNETEKNIFKAADLTAYLLEMQEWKYLGLRHDGWEMIWFNMVDRLGKIDLPFIPELVDELKVIYKEGVKRPSPFLAKRSKQSNPEHRL